MTTERFMEDMLLHGWREANKGEDNNGRNYVLLEKEDLFLFLVENHLLTDGLYGGEWEVEMEEIKVLRNRRQYLEIETKGGESYEISSTEEEFEVGCKG